MPFLSLKTCRLFYTHKRGDAELPTLLLLHGAGGDHLVWPAGLRRLSAYTVIAPDLPGHGRSGKPGRQTITDFAADMAAFMGAINLESAVIIGHSMGGAIAQMMALRYPYLTAGLVLANTGARLPVADAILEDALNDFEAAVAFISRYQWAPGTPTAFIEAGQERMRQTGPQVLYDDFVACNIFNVMARLPQIQVPTLVLAGEADKMTPPAAGQFLAAHIPGAELVIIPGAGHMMILEQPDSVTSAVAVFLRTYFPARRSDPPSHLL